jgi:hypothetical protein
MSDKPAAYKPAFAMDKLKEKKVAEAESAEVPLTQPSKVVDDDDIEMDEVPGSEPDESDAEEEQPKPKEEKKDKKAPPKPKEDSEQEKPKDDKEEDKPKAKKEEEKKPKAKEEKVEKAKSKEKPKKDDDSDEEEEKAKKPKPKEKPKKDDDSDEEEEKAKKPKPVAAPKAKKVLFKDNEEKKEVKKPKESKKRKKSAGEVELELPQLSPETRVVLSTLSTLGSEDQKRIVEEFVNQGLDAENLLNESLKGLIHDAYATQLQITQQFQRFQRVLSYFNVKLTGPNIKLQNLSCTPKSAPRKPLLQRVFCEGGKTKEEFKEFMAKVKAKDEKALARHKKLVAQQEALHKEMIAKAAKEAKKDGEPASVTVDAKLFHNYRIVNCEGNEDLPETTVEVAKSNKKASKQSKPRAVSKKAAKKPVEEEDEALESDWSDEDEAEEEELGDDGEETEEDVKPKDKKAKHK